MKILLFLPLIFTVGCGMVGPDYQKPSSEVAATYKAVGLTQPASSGAWWKSFSDSKLTALLNQAEKNNPDARSALARLDQARLTLGITKLSALPILSAEALSVRRAESGNDRFPSPGAPFDRYESTLNLTYEIDFWGRVRRGVAQTKALSEAAEGDYAVAVLSIKAEVARDYMTLRYLDEEITLLSETIGLRAENERLVKARVDAGDTTNIDLSRATSQTETARAEFYRLKQRRSELENAIGVLVGANPSQFKIKPSVAPRTPRVPSGLPADLLRRRPDVYASERRLAGASENIGVTIGKYLPRVTLTAAGGYGALQSSDLFNRGSQLWNIGPDISIPLFPFGRRVRDTKIAKSAYLESLEMHRKSVLNAFRDVENALSGIENLDRALAAQKKSADAAKEATRLIQLRYDAGLVSFFEVIDAQRDSLAEQRALVQTRSARQLATVQLIQALGGGWKE